MIRRLRTAARRLAALASAAAALALAAPAAAQEKDPVVVGLDAEFGLEESFSAQAIELGLRAAIHEINAAGGVLKGRPLQLLIKEHRSMPARGIRNINEFAATPNVVAVFGGRFSPVIIEELPALKAAKMPFMAVWSSADMIIDNGMQPNYIFRVSLRDSLAMPHMLRHARRRGHTRVGLLLTNTSWGRSNLAAAEKHIAATSGQKIVDITWYNWRDTTLVAQYRKLVEAGAQTVLLVANDDEAAILVKEVAGLPKQLHVPIVSHWGVTGGEFFKNAGPALHELDFTVIQTFSFFRADRAMTARFLRTAAQISDVRRIEDIRAPVGVAHAYDAMHLLARAIDRAGSTDRSAIRDALEKLPPYRGLVRHYNPPFSAERHEALGPEELLMVRYDRNGVLVPVED